MGNCSDYDARYPFKRGQLHALVRKQSIAPESEGGSLCHRRMGRRLPTRPNDLIFYFSSSDVHGFSQASSMSSLSATNSNGILTVQGFVYAFGSSIVNSSCIWPKSMRRKRSIVCSASECG